MPYLKALALTIWDKKVFKDLLLYLYVKSETNNIGLIFSQCFSREPLNTVKSVYSSQSRDVPKLAAVHRLAAVHSTYFLHINIIGAF